MVGQNATSSHDSLPARLPSDGQPGTSREGILARPGSGDGRHQSPASKHRPPPLHEMKERVDQEKYEDISKPSTGVDEHGAGCKLTLV